MNHGAALSEHPVAAEAVGEVVGAVLDTVGDAPGLAALFVSPRFGGAIDEIAAAVLTMLRPAVLLGAMSTTVLGGRREVEEGPAIALWAVRVDGVQAVRIVTESTADGVRVGGVPAAGRDEDRTLVLLGDPFTLPAEGLLTTMSADLPLLTVVGGLVASGGGPGSTRLLLGDEVFPDGAVGALLPRDVESSAFVAQGCHPVGEPMIVTAAEGNVVLELAGRPALDRLVEVGRSLTDDVRARFHEAPQVGLVVDEAPATFGTGDFLVRSVTGLVADRRAVAVGSRVPVGTTVQCHVGDPDGAAEHLADDLGRVDRALPGVDRGGLVFTCTGRGRGFFGPPDHDAEMVADHLGPAVAGVACAGEIGPVGGSNHVHSLSAAVLTLGTRSRPADRS